ncbi:hypothetical protein MMPV_006359 [Pyropia vietnamensis]
MDGTGVGGGAASAREERVGKDAAVRMREEFSSAAASLARLFKMSCEARASGSRSAYRDIAEWAVRKRREVTHDVPCSNLLRELIELCTRQLAEDFHASGQAAIPPAARASSVPASAEGPAGSGPTAAAVARQTPSTPPPIPTAAAVAGQTPSTPPPIPTAPTASTPVTSLTDSPPIPHPPRGALPPVSAAAGPSEPSSLAAYVGNLTVGKKRGRCWSWAEQLSAAGESGFLGAEAPRSCAGGGGSGGALGGGGGGGGGNGGGSSASGMSGADGLIRAFGLCNEMAMLDSPPLSAKRCKGPHGSARKDKRDKDKEREQREWEKLNRK